MRNLRFLTTVSFVLTLVLSVVGCREQGAESPAEQGIGDAKPPEQLISLSQAQSMYQSYSRRRSPLIQRYEDSINLRKQDTTKFDVGRYVYYDYKTIKQYLAYIEGEAERAGVSIESLRFYFSNYPEKEQFEDGRPVKHPRQNSIMLLPTLKQNGEEFGFLIEETGEGKNIPYLLNGQLEPYATDGMGVIEGQGGKSLAGMLPDPFVVPALPFQTLKSTILNEGNGAPPPYK